MQRLAQWLPQLLWRLSWFSPLRLCRQWLATAITACLPNATAPNRLEGTLLLLRVLAGVYILLLGILSATNDAWAAHFRGQCQYWASQHPNFLVQDILNGIIIPHAELWSGLWAISHCWAGLGLILGLLLTPAINVILVWHSLVIVASLPNDATTALTHLPMVMTLPLLALAYLGQRWGLDYWHTPSAELDELGLTGVNNRHRKATTYRRRPLKPTPDLDDPDDDNNDTTIGLSYFGGGDDDNDD